MSLFKQLLPSPANVLSSRAGKCRTYSQCNSISPLVLVALLLISRFSFAAPAQLISVKETRPGRVTATVGIFTAGPVNPEDFWLRFDGKNAVRAKEVEPAPPVAAEPSVILLIDQGGAMGGSAVMQARQALKEMVSGPSFPASVALWVFDSEVKKLRGFSDISKLAEDIDQIGVAVGRADKTKLYEVIGLALSELHSNPAEGPKRLVVITAGRDDDSSISEQVVLDEASREGIAIDTIGSGNISEEGSKLLARLARDTAGQYVPPVATASELARSLRKLFDSPPSHVVKVLFAYDPVVEGHKAASAQLEFVPDGKRILLPIRNELVFPKEGPLGGGLPYHPAIGQENVKDLILVWISIGLTGFLAAYTMSRILRRKRGKSGPKEQPTESNWEP